MEGYWLVKNPETIKQVDEALPAHRQGTSHLRQTSAPDCLYWGGRVKNLRVLSSLRTKR